MDATPTARRSRRRRGFLPRALGIGTLGLLLVLVVGVFGLYQWAKGYVRSEGFRALVEGQASRLLQAEVKLEPLEWERLDVRSPGLKAGAGPAFSKLQADELRATLALGGLTRRVWKVEAARIENLVVDFKKPTAVSTAPPPAVAAAGAESSSAPPGWLNARIEVPQVGVRNTNLRFGTGDLDFRLLGSGAVLVERGDGSYDLELRGGAFSMAPFPGAGVAKKAFDLREASARIQSDAVYLVNSTLADANGTTVSVEGTIPLSAKAHNLSLHTSIDGLPVAEVVGPEWTNRIFGRLALDIRTLESEGGTTHEGTVRLADARLVTPEPSQPDAGGVAGMVRQGWRAFSGTLLPALGAYTDRTRQFRNLACDTASARFRKQGDHLELHRIEIVSKGLVSVEGDLAVEGDTLNGLVQLGVTRATLSGIPGAESKVFTTERDGLLWTPVRIGGTLRDPQEDLTQRLIDAAGQRILEAVPELGFGLLRGAGNAVKQGAAGVLDTGGKVIDTGAGILGEGGRLLEGLLAPGTSNPEPAPKEAPAPQTPGK